MNNADDQPIRVNLSGETKQLFTRDACRRHGYFIAAVFKRAMYVWILCIQTMPSLEAS